MLGVAVIAPQSLPFLPVIYVLSFGYPLIAAAIGSTIHAASLAVIVARFGWPRRPLDIWRYMSVGFILGALAGFVAAILTNNLYGGFKGSGPEWHGGLAGGLCAAWTTVHGLRNGPAPGA